MFRKLGLLRRPLWGAASGEVAQLGQLLPRCGVATQGLEPASSQPGPSSSKDSRPRGGAAPAEPPATDSRGPKRSVKRQRRVPATAAAAAAAAAGLESGQEQQPAASEGPGGGQQALLLAASKGRAAEVEALLGTGAAPAAGALHAAAAGGHMKTVRLLLAAGADPSAARPGDGATPLHLAAAGGHTATVGLLVAAGADVAARDARGTTPLQAMLRQQRRQAQLRRTSLEAEYKLSGGAAAGTSGGKRSLQRREAGAEPTPPEGAASATSSSSSSSSSAAEPAAGVGAEAGALGLRWLIKWSELSELEEMDGSGSFATVFVGRWRRTPVAVKLFRVEGRGGEVLQEETLEALRQEAAVLSGLRAHPNIVRFLGACEEPPAIVMELAGRSSLYDLLVRARRDPSVGRQLTWARRISMLLAAARGMLHLHEHGYLHRDLKSANLLVGDGLELVVADFNLTIHESTADAAHVARAMRSIHPRWLAPEVAAGGPASRASDVYAFGLIMWSLLTWSDPWAELCASTASGDGSELIEAALARGERPAIPMVQELPGPRAAAFAGLGPYLDLMQRCWAEDPGARPSFHRVIDGLEALAASAAV